MPRGSPLRIALVVERLAPGTGGVENVAWQVARELVRRGERVSVIAREAVPCDGLEIVRVRSAGRRSPGRTLSFSRAAAAAVRTGRFDVVHGFSRTRHQDLFRAGGGSHADHLARSHGPLGRTLRRLQPRHASLLALDRAVFADPRQRIQCASRLVADRLITHHGVDATRILLLPNAVDAGRFDRERHAEAAHALRQRLDALAERVWLFAGSGWHRKGLARCFAALTRIRDPRLSLWVAGRDDAAAWRRRARRAGLAERVRFIGPRDDLEVVYAAVDGLVLPTRYDPFANVTFEAAAAGLPIVTSRGNGAAEWLSREACVVVGSDGDASDDDEALGPALADALGRVSDTDLGRRMGEAARREVRRFDWGDHVAALQAEYARIVAARGPASAPADATPSARRDVA
ncbi:MAG: glycosyltransferase family 4 protein [Myxococcota bacterium]